MQIPFPHLSRTRVALIVGFALGLTPVLLAVLALAPGERAASALPSQFRTTRPRSTATAPETTADEPTTTRSRPRPTPAEPASTRAPTTAARATTKRPTASAQAGASSSTTFPTLPPSTATPELLVAGPVNPVTGESEGATNGGDGVSTSAALRWVIIGLVLVGLAIAGLTVAYWRHTRPKSEPSWDGDDRDDPPADPPAGPGPGFTPVARGGSELYGEPGTVTWRKPAGNGGYANGDGGSGPRGGGGGGGTSGGAPLWERSPAVGAAERYEPPWNAR
jgi:uncharacterized membrane protein YgcG